MKPIDDIIYSQTNYAVLLLYDNQKSHINLLLPNIHLLPFIHYFTNIDQCQEYINTNRNKIITLYIDENNIQWLIVNSFFINIRQIEKINIFFSSSSTKSQLFPYQQVQRSRRKIDNLFLSKDLDFKLLLFGLNHIDTVREQYTNDYGILNRLDEDYRKICEILTIYFSKKAVTGNQIIRLSEEAQN